MKKNETAAEAVSGFIAGLPAPFSSLVEDIRQAVLDTSTLISEHIKWNSPAFYFNGAMEAFEAKEYKRDLLVIHTRKNIALLVFPTGHIITSEHTIMEGNYADGRRMITIKSAEEFQAKRAAMQAAIRCWLEQVR